MFLEITVGLLALVAGIIDNPLHRICAAQLLHKRNCGFCIRPVCRNVGADNILAHCGNIHIVGRLQLPVAHMVFLQPHKSGLSVCLAITASVSTNADLTQILCDSAHPFLNLFENLLSI